MSHQTFSLEQMLNYKPDIAKLKEEVPRMHQGEKKKTVMEAAEYGRKVTDRMMNQKIGFNDPEWAADYFRRHENYPYKMMMQFITHYQNQLMELVMYFITIMAQFLPVHQIANSLQYFPMMQM